MALSAMRNAKSLSCRNRTEVVRNPKPNNAKGTMRASTSSGARLSSRIRAAAMTTMVASWKAASKISIDAASHRQHRTSFGSG
jgi:hypothetical protein